jgi:hypothetical protein
VEREQVHEAIQQLPVEFRETSLLREYEELSYQEIAVVLAARRVMSRPRKASIETSSAAFRHLADSRSAREGILRMNRRDEHTADILLYLNDALTGHRLDEFREHLASCPDCSAQLEDELALSSFLRKSRPLYSAPETLRGRVEDQKGRRLFTATQYFEQGTIPSNDELATDRMTRCL